MTRIGTRLLQLLVVLLLFAACRSVAAATGRLDSVLVIKTPDGDYVCCLSMAVRNQQLDSTIRITDFRLRVLSGKATFLQGRTVEPSRWTLVSQTSTEVRWTSNTASADITVGSILYGYEVCVADTGVCRIAWETHTLDSMLSSDTIVVTCKRFGCDEPFFNVLPSQTRAVLDIDLVIGNGTGNPVNNFALHPLTPGVRLNTGATTLPTNWTRIKSKTDTIIFFKRGAGLEFGDFVEGLRVELDSVVADSTVDLEWWTTFFGDLICIDTVTLRFGVSRRDSLLRVGDVRPSGAGCCADLVLKNTHQPGTPIDSLTLKVLATGSRIDTLPVLPPEWTARLIGLDSLVLTIPGGLAPADTALLAGLCIDNAQTTSDSIKLRWTTYYRDVAIMTGTTGYRCFRALTSCDAVSAAVDSSAQGGRRCISMAVRNTNNRRDPITRLTLRVSNPGVARRVLSATPPAPWRVVAAAGDSAVFTGGSIVAGATTAPFVVCVSDGEPGMLDPVMLVATTGHNPGPSCSDTLALTTLIIVACDTVLVTPQPSPNDSTACYQVIVRNQNAKARPISRMRFELPASGNAIFSSASVTRPWSVLTTGFPTFDVDVEGDTVRAGQDGPPVSFCIDTRFIQTLPAVIPVVWRTIDQGTQVCYDTLRLLWNGNTSTCDTIPRIANRITEPSVCEATFRLVNRHTPAPGPIDGLTFRIVDRPATGPVATIRNATTRDGAAAWTVALQNDSVVIFRGAPVASGDSLEKFDVVAGGVDMFTFEACTMIGDQLMCCARQTLVCSDAGVEVPLAPIGFVLAEPIPNPAGTSASVGYSLRRSGAPVIVVRDVAGREMMRIAEQMREVGTYHVAIDCARLVPGIYYISLEVNGERDTRRIVVVR